MLRMIDTFSGIGGFSLAARWLGGIETVQFVEREPYCQRILRKHWPDVPIHDDICTFNPAPGSADIICGGFPCQDISTAGKQAGIKEGTRSGLFYELMRVVRLVGPRYVVLENVAAITSNGLDAVLGTLAEAGFDAEWACIPAADVGACHRRDRWWCVAYANHAGVEAPWSEQFAAGAEQHGELDAAYASGERRRQITGCPSSDESEDEGRATLHNHVACGVGPERNGTTDSAAHPARMLSDGQQVGHIGQSGGRAVSESGDCGGAGDAADAERGGGEAERQRAELAAAAAGARSDWAGSADTAGRGGEAAPHPHHQRQQERQPATIAGGTGWTGWGDAPRRLNPDWRSYLSEPVLCRGDDGLSGRVDRLKALGNAVVPQVAMVPLARVLELSRST